MGSAGAGSLTGARAYAAADTGRLFAGFSGTSATLDSELQSGLPTLRARSRQLAMDNDYARKFLAMVKANVVGRHGIQLQAEPRREDGSIDRPDATYIESAWKRWGSVESCSVTRRLSWHDVQRLAIESVARDGEVLLRLVRGFDNPFGFALQVLEADYLDERLNNAKPDGDTDGRRIVMGVEKDAWGAPVAYHLRTSHPGNRAANTGVVLNGSSYERVPAADVIHLYLTERPDQTRGVPWMTTAIRRLQMLGGYEEAELVASRIAASKMGFYVSPDADAYVGDDEETDGALISEAEPGIFEQLPSGTSFETFDPSHPTTAFRDFCKAVLRGASAGLGVSYNSLANDLEGVNYSSIRAGVLEERDQWRVLQDWLAAQLCDRVFGAWLDASILAGALTLPPRRIDKFRAATWVPRGFPWVDPLKDRKAATEGVALGVQTRAQIAAQQGDDLEDIFEQLGRERDLAEKYSINVEPVVEPAPAQNAAGGGADNAATASGSANLNGKENDE